jgi:phosphatidylglycerol:prolipoprotein diacylglycerol transferase
MYPKLFDLPLVHIPIYGYGLMMVFAFLGCQWLAARLATRRGLDPEVFVNATLIALVSGVAGARLSHVLENWHDYTRPELGMWQNLWDMVNIRSGGLTLYGGLILATPITLWYFVHKGVNAKVALDVAAPCVALGIAIGRLGCFLNGCCYGADTNLAWGVTFPYGSNAYIDQFAGTTGEHLLKPPPPQLFKDTPTGQRLYTADEAKADPELRPIAAANRSNPVHPTQLYSTINALLIMMLVLAYIGGPHPAGRGLALLLMLEGPTRFLLELLRVEPPVLGPMSLSMVLGLGLFVVGIALWFTLAAPRERPLAFPPLPA